MRETYRPAECFPLGHFIAEELEARGWTVQELAERMGGAEELDIHHLTLDLLIYIPDDPRQVVGDKTFGKLSMALGVDEGVLRRIDSSYRTWLVSRN